MCGWISITYVCSTFYRIPSTPLPPLPAVFSLKFPFYSNSVVLEEKKKKRINHGAPPPPPLIRNHGSVPGDYCSVYDIVVDGHHKLIRWRFITHGGIDGFSRLVVYLSVQLTIKPLPYSMPSRKLLMFMDFHLLFGQTKVVKMCWWLASC